MIYFYFLAAFFVAFLGRHCRTGFFGTLLLALVLTPLLVGVAVMVFGRPRPALSSD